MLKSRSRLAAVIVAYAKAAQRASARVTAHTSPTNPTPDIAAQNSIATAIRRCRCPLATRKHSMSAPEAAVLAGQSTKPERNNSTAVAALRNQRAETFLATSDQRANRRPSWLVKLSTTPVTTLELRHRLALHPDFVTLATLRTLITMRVTAQVQRGPIRTFIIRAINNTATAILAKATFMATSPELCDDRRGKQAGGRDRCAKA